jgi:hypothetical protein
MLFDQKEIFMESKKATLVKFVIAIVVSILCFLDGIQYLSSGLSASTAFEAMILSGILPVVFIGFMICWYSTQEVKKITGLVMVILLSIILCVFGIYNFTQSTIWYEYMASSLFALVFPVLIWVLFVISRNKTK